MKFISFLISLLLSAMFFGCIAAEGWQPLPTTAPTPAQSGTVQTDPVQADGVAVVGLSWVTPIGDVINWSPQLLMDNDGNSLLVVSSEAGSVLGLDTQSGEERWRFTPPARLWSDSVTVVNDAVFAASEGGDITLLNGMTGDIRWQRNIRPTAGPEQPGLEARSRVTLVDGALYIPTAGIGSYVTVSNPDLHAPLIAVDMADGEEIWRVTTDNFILRAPVVDSATDTLYVGGNYLSDQEIDEGGPNRIYAIDPRDGATLWSYESEDGLVKSMWAGDGRLVFVGYQDFLVGLNAGNGEEVWRDTTGNWVQSFAVFDDPAALSTAPELVYGSANAFLHAVDPLTGQERWRYNIDGTFNYPMGSAVLADDAIYFISQQGDLHALDAATGALNWKFATGLETRDGIAVGAGHLYVGSVNGAVYAYHLPRP